ncbi:MAG: hypothetical protein A2508_01945 [Candidatus Lambdaproteobacteria bacterium RIFOXYD12_FULL_49_8]|nr:MAG: hypothetical protein A2508_01945 [Candidatus Lambdaproteobacteria bacterium RIFOXYD12_FULL_49_8]
MNRRWILLRGLIRDQRHFEGFEKRLAEFTGDEVFCIDLPGNGSRYKETSPNSIADMALGLRKEAKRLQIEPPYHILAVSLGGMVALEWTHLFRPEIAGLVIINTSAKGLTPFYQRLRWQNYQKIVRNLLLSDSVKLKEATIIDLTLNLYPDQLALLKRWIQYAQERPTRRINGLRQLWAASNYTLPLPLPHLPTLILASAKDRLVAYENSLILAKLAGGVAQVHPQAGHELLLDDPAWVLTQLEAWLAPLDG